LLDPTLPPDRLLYRLFHEEGVRAFPPATIEAYCRCSRERVEGFLRSFGAKELTDMREPDGSISVTCEFCTKTYRFAPDEIA
jgi:molecular chaperone Hsp33